MRHGLVAGLSLAGHLAVVEKLLTAGANFEAQNNNGAVPLHIAASYHSAPKDRVILSFLAIGFLALGSTISRIS